MAVALRILALVLLAGTGYAAYRHAIGVLEVQRQGQLLQNLDAIFLAAVFTLGALLLALLVFLGRRSAASEGGKPRFRFGSLARFAAALGLVGGVRTILAPALDLRRMWTQGLLDDLIRHPDGPRTLALTLLVLALGLASVGLALLVLFSPRNSA